MDSRMFDFNLGKDTKAIDFSLEDLAALERRIEAFKLERQGIPPAFDPFPPMTPLKDVFAEGRRARIHHELAANPPTLYGGEIIMAIARIRGALMAEEKVYHEDHKWECINAHMPVLRDPNALAIITTQA